MITLVRIFTLLFIYLVIDISKVDSSCPPKTSTHNLFVTVNPLNTVSGINARYLTIYCCVDGFQTMLWYFRKLNDQKWYRPYSAINYSDYNRTLIFIEPYDTLHDGFYHCSAEGYNGQNFNHTMFVYFLKVNESKAIRILQWNKSLEPKYNPGDNVNITCKGMSYSPDVRVEVTWTLNKTGEEKSISRPYNVATTIITAADRYYESNPDFIEVESSLVVKDLKKEDSGIYICQMMQNITKVKIGFQLSVIDDRLNLPLLISLIVGTILILISFILSWWFHNSIIFLYKSYFDPCPRGQCREIDVSIIYEDMDIDNIRISIEMVKDLERRGFRCWYYDRDKLYGRDIKEEYASCLEMSNVAVIFLSSFSVLENSLLRSLLSIVPDPAIRRLYIFNPNKVSILQLLLTSQPRTMRWIKKELRLQSIFRSNSINIGNRKLDEYSYVALLTWIMSFVPSEAIRMAMRRSVK